MFKKVIGKECKNGNCKMYGQMKEATAYLCEECQSELQPIVKQNTPMVLAVAAGSNTPPPTIVQPGW